MFKLDFLSVQDSYITNINLKSTRNYVFEDDRKAVKVILRMKFVATQTLLVKRHILMRHPDHYSIDLNSTVVLATMVMIQQTHNIERISS